MRVPSVPGHCGGRSPACAASRAGYRNCAWTAPSSNTRYRSHPKSVPPHRCRCRTGMPSPAQYSRTAPPSFRGLSALPARTERAAAPAKTDGSAHVPQLPSRLKDKALPPASLSSGGGYALPDTRYPLWHKLRNSG